MISSPETESEASAVIMQQSIKPINSDNIVDWVM